MAKGTKIALVVMLVLAAVCIAGLWSLVSNTQQQLADQREQARRVGNEILVLVASSWDEEAFALRTAKDFDENVGGVDAALEGWRADFGGLASGDLDVSDFYPTDGAGGPLLVAVLEGSAEFDKGAGHVTMTLTREPRNAWMLSDIEVTPAP